MTFSCAIRACARFTNCSNRRCKACWARVELLPHQLYIAHSVASRHAPRVLLADEVGLGKTIDGLIIHQQLTSARQRVLIAVPEALQHRGWWKCCAALTYPLVCSMKMRQLLETQELTEDGNPFETEQLVLWSATADRKLQRSEQALACQWDLLVVDEAHHLQWREDGTGDLGDSDDNPANNLVSHAYRCIEALQNSRRVDYADRHPEQLGVESHFARLRLLDPDRYHDLNRFCEEQAQYLPLNDLVQGVLSAESIDDCNERHQQLLQEFVGPERIADWQANPAIASELVRELLDRHGTGRVLYRNTRASVKGFPQRQLQPHALATPEAYSAAISGDTPVQHLLQAEQLLGDNWLDADTRVSWLSAWLKANRSLKGLIICARAETALDLETHLRLRGNTRSAAFHEGMSILERDRAAAYFADEIDGAQVLVCSEIGSEGRNFQFAHHMVLFDLPLNPDLLEQRIGRLDRIGQQHTVNIHVPYFEHTAQHTLLRWYHEGINGFERVCPIGQNIFDNFSEQLLPQLRSKRRATTRRID